MARTKSPTLKQKTAFNEMIKAVKAGNGMNMKQIMVKAGYAPATAINPELNLTSKKNWQDMLAEVDTQPLLSRLNDIARTADHDASIKAIKELFTLKDLYPATKSKIVGLFEKIESVKDNKDNG